MSNFDFSGWATRNNLLCGDGRTIRKDAFKDNDGQVVPLVWNHDHTRPDSVLGHALLENKSDGVYAYGTFNDTEAGREAKKLVENGDIRSLSIYANNLKHVGADVVHGSIKELSLVLAGANPGAYIDYVLAHSDEESDSLFASWDENALVIYHSDDASKDDKTEEKSGDKGEEKDKDESKAGNEKTVKDVVESMTKEQQDLMYALIAQAIEDTKNANSESDDNDDTKEESKGEDEMKHNLFENEEKDENVLAHSAMETIIKDAKRYGSMKDSFLAHADEYGIESIDYLFPDAKNMENEPSFIGREMDWVSTVMNGTHHTPFSRIKSMFADITEDQARAKGYIKGNLKKEEVFSLLKRTTTPTTIYKKQKLDRDDVIDITDFDVIAWLKKEMRMMLDEEIARAILIGDGRLASDDDHINDQNIRPILNDADLFTIRWNIGSTNKAKDFITACIKSRKNYRGSGNPTLFTTEDMLTDMLLLEDTIGHKLYKTEAELATALRVSKIVTVPVMETAKDKDNKDVYGIIVNLNDYNVGADKGGAVNMFDDFDIDYNQQKYLIETRCSGALVRPFSAIVLRAGTTTASAEPTMANAMAPFKPVKEQDPEDEE